MIKISHETPLQLLQLSLNYNHYQYILPYFWNRFPEYKKFMLDYSTKNQSFTILDCGLFEGEVPSIKELIDLIDEIKPNIFISVDSWNNCNITYQNAKTWMDLKKSGKLPKKTELMVVLQGTNFSQIEQLYKKCLNLGYIHFAFNHSSIAYQNEIKDGDEIYKAKKGRIKLIRNLWNKNIIEQNHYIHLLGATDITEFEYYKKGLRGVVNSIDSSSPIIKAIEDGLYTEENIKLKSNNKLEKYFESNFDKEQIECILTNINFFKQITNG